MNKLDAIEQRLNALQKAFEQAQKNQIPITGKAENAENKAKALEPYKKTKTAYIDDTEVIFTSVPHGNLSVFVVDSENNYPAYTLERTADRLKVSFEPCTSITTVTISVL